MGRLTIKDEQGNWALKGVKWNQLHVGETITQQVQEKIYGALAKLKDYEDSGMTPDECWDCCVGRSVKNTMAEIETFEVKRLFRDVKAYFVKCKCCKNRTEINFDKKDSITAWNRRVNDGKID